MSGKMTLNGGACARVADITSCPLDDDPAMEVSTIKKTDQSPRRTQVRALRMREDYHWEHAPYDPTLAEVITELRSVCYNALPQHVRDACKRDPAGRGNTEFYFAQY